MILLPAIDIRGGHAVRLEQGAFDSEKIYDADQDAVVAHVMHDSAAAKAGIRDGDRIVRFDGKVNPTWEDISLKEISSAGRALDVEVERNGKIIHTTVAPVLDDRSGVGFAGWAAPAMSRAARGAMKSFLNM